MTKFSRCFHGKDTMNKALKSLEKGMKNSLIFNGSEVMKNSNAQNIHVNTMNKVKATLVFNGFLIMMKKLYGVGINGIFRRSLNSCPMKIQW